MTLIPDCRKKYLTDAYPNGTYHRSHSEISSKELNPYYQGNLNEEDQAFLNGYDYAIHLPVRNLFNNLDVYADELEELTFLNKLFGKDWLSQLDLEAIDSDELPKGTPLNAATRFFRLLRLMLFDFSEMERNELIVSMIDGYPDDDESPASQKKT